MKNKNNIKHHVLALFYVYARTRTHKRNRIEMVWYEKHNTVDAMRDDDDVRLDGWKKWNKNKKKQKLNETEWKET